MSSCNDKESVGAFLGSLEVDYASMEALPQFEINCIQKWRGK